MKKPSCCVWLECCVVLGVRCVLCILRARVYVCACSVLVWQYTPYICDYICDMLMLKFYTPRNASHPYTHFFTPSQIQDPEPFATFEVSTTDEERVLDGGERVLDVLASWQHSFDEDKAKNKKGGREVETFRFMFNKEGSVLGAASAFSSGKHTSYCQMHGKR